MAVTIDVAHLAAAVRVSPTNAVPPAPMDGILGQKLSVATATVEDYAPDAPSPVQNEAVVLMVGYLLDAPPTPRTPPNAFILCGSRSLLARWRTPVAIEPVA